MKDGFVRVAAATPRVRVADCKSNSEEIIKLIRQAASNDCSLVCFPELSITGYTCGDLFLSDCLIDAAKDALLDIAKETADLNIVAVVGLPVKHNGKLYNCGAVLSQGRISGLVPKTNIPNYSEFYELRHFTAFEGDFPEETGIGDDICMGKFIFSNFEKTDFSFALELCEDLWVPVSPSVDYCINGAKIICNLSASDEVIGKEEYRRSLVSMQSAKCCCVYIYCDCGFGESTQDMVFAGHNIIAENGSILAESKLFDDGIIYADCDLKRLDSERRRMNTFPKGETEKYPVENFFTSPCENLKLNRHISATPFVPESDENLNKRCEKILSMQASGLATRLSAIGLKSAVVGLSGGLDSTLALIVAVHAFDRLELDRRGICAVTMPCFGTTDRTYNNAKSLADEYGVTLREVNIKDAVTQHFKDIEHDPDVHDVTYENSQARERTQVLMDIANQTGGIVIGTGDLSELALGWATYNGDHMSMYGVNCSIPKTLVRYLVSYEAKRTREGQHKLSDVLFDICDTPVSPELLPPDENGNIAQKTEDTVGPYELHDFFLYYTVRFGFAPSKIYRLALAAFDGKYDEKTIYKWLEVFVKRFFSQQFKRSVLPDGPKVGTVTLSPRGDWRMPSDASSAMWLSDLRKVNPNL